MISRSRLLRRLVLTARHEIIEVVGQRGLDLWRPSLGIERFGPSRDAMTCDVIMAISERANCNCHVQADLERRYDAHVRCQIPRAVCPEPVEASPCKGAVYLENSSLTWQKTVLRLAFLGPVRHAEIGVFKPRKHIYISRNW